MRLRLSGSRFFSLSKRNKKKIRIITIIAFLNIIILIICGILFKQIYPNFIERISVYGYNYGVEVINSVIIKIAEENRTEKFSDIIKDNDGNIVSVETDTMAMNLFKAKLVKGLNEKLSNINAETIEIPVGSLLNEEIFAAYGPKIKIKVIPIGIANADFSEDFISVGINQVKHKIYLKVSFKLSFVSASMNKTETITAQVPISETFIVGEIPKYYGGNITTAPDCEN